MKVWCCQMDLYSGRLPAISGCGCHDDTDDTVKVLLIGGLCQDHDRNHSLILEFASH